MTDKRPRVSKLHRLYPSQNSLKFFYYSPDGHCSDGFDTEHEMEAEIAKYYNEVGTAEDIQ